MDLSTIDPAVIEARGKYATVNGEYKTLMSVMQSWTQQACDVLRNGLQEQDMERAIERFKLAEKIANTLQGCAQDAAELKAQKDEFYQIAWGKK